jgi:hypothetical protein
MSHYKGGGPGPKFGLTKYSDLPEMLPVGLKAGQTIFWEGDLIHRGSMHPGVERATLHCSMGVQPAAAKSEPSPCDKRCVVLPGLCVCAPVCATAAGGDS